MKNFTNIFFFIILLAATLPQLSCAQTPLLNRAWVDTVRQASVAQNNLAAATDGINLYALQDVNGYQLRKIDANGNTAWLTQINSDTNITAYETAISIKNGYLFATGFSYNAASGTAVINTIKLNANTGDTIFTRSYQGSYGGYDISAAILSDDSGNIYVAGTSETGILDFAMVLIKYDSLGNQLFISSYDSAGLYSGAVAMALTPRGNIVLTGVSGTGFSSYNFLTAWFSPGGTLRHVAYSANSGSSFSQPVGIIRGLDNSITIAGTAATSGASIIKLVNYDDSTYAQRWLSTYGDSILPETASAIAADGNGNLAVSGTATNANGGTNMVALCFNQNTGALKWSRQITAPNPAAVASAASVAYDNNGNALITGQIFNGNNYVIQTVSLAAANGNTNFAAAYNANGAAAAATSVLVDSANNIYLTGNSAVGADTTYIAMQLQQWSPAPCSEPGDKVETDSASGCPTVTYNFKNGHITTAGTDTFLEFDVYTLQNTPSLGFASGTILIAYNTATFGANVVDSNNIIVTKGAVTTDSNYVISLTDTLMQSDAVPPNGGEVQLAIAAQDTNSLYAIADTQQQLCHVKMKIKTVGNFEMRFDQFFMQNQSAFDEYGSAPYNYVYTGGQLAESDEDNDVDLTYSIVNMALDTTVNPPNLTFDIVANASADVPLEDADIWVLYNPSTLSLLSTANVQLAWAPGDGGDNGNYNTTINTYSGEFEILISADNLPNAFHDITTSNTPEQVATVTMQVINCSGEDGLALDSIQMEEGSEFLDDSANTLGYYNVICTPTTSGNNQACTECPGTDVVFSFSNWAVTYDTSGPGANGGQLQFTVNFSPTSTQFTSGFLFSTTVIIDYNNTIFGDIVSNSGFHIRLDTTLTSDNFITTINNSGAGQFSVALQQVVTPLAFTFGQAATPLFTVTMPFDNSNVNCNNSSHVQFDVAMNSDSGAGQVLTYYDTTASTANPNTFCTENIVNNDTLYNTNPCANPIVEAVNAGIHGDQCPTAGSMVPVQITGAHFLNGYKWAKLDTTFTGNITFINADHGDYCTTCTVPNTLSSGWATKTNIFDILNWTDTLIQLLVPTSHSATILQGNTSVRMHETAGSGPFKVGAPSGQSSAGYDKIYLEYAMQNLSPKNVPAMLYLTSTQKAATDTPYTTFPLYAFDFNTDLFHNDSAVAAIIAALGDIRCDIGAPFYLDPDYANHVLNNSSVADTTLAKDGINEILMVDSTNGVIVNEGSTTLAITIIKGHFSGCYNYSSSSPNYPVGYAAFCETGIDIYINETPHHPYNYQLSGNINSANGEYSFLTLIQHELGHGMLIGHSNHNPFLTGTAQTGDFSNRIMYYTRYLGEPDDYYYRDPDDARGAIRTLQWPTNADGQNYNNITLSSSCTSMAVAAIQKLDTPGCYVQLVPKACSADSTTVWEDINNPQAENVNFGVTVYPNPSQNNAILQIDVYEDAEFNIRVFDIVGHEIYETKKSSSIPFQVPLNMESVATGIYLINVSCSTGQQQTIKFIKTY